jgi:hypothetical protein
MLHFSILNINFYPVALSSKDSHFITVHYVFPFDGDGHNSNDDDDDNNIER